MKIGRHALATAVTAVALLAPASPAAATHDAPRCTEFATVGLPYVSVSLCVSASGVYDPVTVECNTITGCWARVTAGLHRSANVDADVCFDTELTEPFCVGAGTGEIPLVPVPPQTFCVNDSPWGPPCEPHDG